MAKRHVAKVNRAIKPHSVPVRGGEMTAQQVNIIARIRAVVTLRIGEMKAAAILEAIFRAAKPADRYPRRYDPDE